MSNTFVQYFDAYSAPQDLISNLFRSDFLWKRNNAWNVNFGAGTKVLIFQLRYLFNFSLMIMSLLRQKFKNTLRHSLIPKFIKSPIHGQYTVTRSILCPKFAWSFVILWIHNITRLLINLLIEIGEILRTTKEVYTLSGAVMDVHITFYPAAVKFFQQSSIHTCIVISGWILLKWPVNRVKKATYVNSQEFEWPNQTGKLIKYSK